MPVKNQKFFFDKAASLSRDLEKDGGVWYTYAVKNEKDTNGK